MQVDNKSKLLDTIDECLSTIKKIRKIWLQRGNESDLERHATSILKIGYEKSLKESYSKPKHLMYIFKINQMLNLILELFKVSNVSVLLNEWFNSKDQTWKLFIFETMILMSDEIQMMIEQNHEFSSLAKVRQYFELYALYYLTSKYGAHVFDYFLIHGVKNMTKFIRYFDPNYQPKNEKQKGDISNPQLKRPYGWMNKIKNLEPQDRKIKNIIQQAIKEDSFLKHIYLNSNFPHHASSFMFATYIFKEEKNSLQRYTKQMVFHTYLWFLNILIKNVKNMFKNKLKKDKSEELQKIYLLFKTMQKYIHYVKSNTIKTNKSNRTTPDVQTMQI